MRYSLFLLFLVFIFSCGNKIRINEKSYYLALQTDTLIRNGRFQDALSLLEKAIKLDSNNYVAYNNLGYVKTELGYPESEIFFAFNKSYELNENYLIGLGSLTNFYFGNKDYTKVVALGTEYLDKAEKANVSSDNLAQILGIIGESYNYLEAYDKAVYFLTKALELNPNKAASYKERGIAYRNLSEYKNALNDFNKAIELNSLYHQAYNSRAIYFDDLDINDKALNDYNEAIKLKPNSSVYYLNRAKLRIKLGEINKACGDIIKSDSLGHPEAHDYYLKYCKNK